eukprot:10582-Eustigmatos_ZCMA.PRE.1
MNAHIYIHHAQTWTSSHKHASKPTSLYESGPAAGRPGLQHAARGPVYMIMSKKGASHTYTQPDGVGVTVRSMASHTPLECVQTYQICMA